MVYIRQQHLANLKNYKYASADHSPISRFVLKPFYNKFVINCFPMSMACVYLSSSRLKRNMADFFSLAP